MWKQSVRGVWDYGATGYSVHRHARTGLWQVYFDDEPCDFRDHMFEVCKRHVEGLHKMGRNRARA